MRRILESIVRGMTYFGKLFRLVNAYKCCRLNFCEGRNAIGVVHHLVAGTV